MFLSALPKDILPTAGIQSPTFGMSGEIAVYMSPPYPLSINFPCPEHRLDTVALAELPEHANAFVAVVAVREFPVQVPAVVAVAAEATEALAICDASAVRN